MTDRRRQTGTTTVEFAIVGALVIMVMFAVVQFGYTMFTLSVLNEGTRRGARVAAVCPVNDAAIAQATAFVSLPGLTTQNVAVEYLNETGGVIANAVANFGAIEFVRVRIVNYQYQGWIPFMNLVFTAPEFAATLPRESLGVPREGVVSPC
jgi:TadE-like protein